jgi:hypothetical protein
MNKENFENIIKEMEDIKNLPNNKLISIMDELSSDFEITKNNIINLTMYLDKVEELYNKTLNEYQLRNNGK